MANNLVDMMAHKKVVGKDMQMDGLKVDLRVGMTVDKRVFWLVDLMVAMRV